MVLLGITGGIAAYKAIELARLFIRNGYQVQVVMTPAATRFVTPLTLKTLTRRPVLIDLFAGDRPDRVEHVDLASRAAVMVVAPASANTLGKFSAGIADNLLTTMFMALKCPAVIVPSMNEQMYRSPAVRHNLQLLRYRGYHLMEPDSGELACGTIGQGRMPEPADIYNFTRYIISKKDFMGVRVLVTAGPTREPLDPVRYLSNPSTGLMGYNLARAFAERGAEVSLVSGPSSLTCPRGVELVPVVTAEQMYEAVMERYPDCQVVVKAAAVADFRPLLTEAEKIKKEEAVLTLQLVPNTDILKTLGEQKGKRILVGFAAETGQPVEKARLKLARKNLDLIVVNDLTVKGAGFASATNQVSIIDSSGKVDELPMMDKQTLAHLILDHIAPLMSVLNH
ncbi:MAG TPA: bifunctional phosphopantothenoylcysteine decarboxylase/phosphopantothenate--cysteine ligase CoaBC [Firmicutes bacterium]|nr:bifunctional phosphopantothenoylcysteine decarboxylase/phosphopantothenate--cysteine ligase CoaBC [Bacillota bacterium]